MATVDFTVLMGECEALAEPLILEKMEDDLFLFSVLGERCACAEELPAPEGLRLLGVMPLSLPLSTLAWSWPLLRMRWPSSLSVLTDWLLCGDLESVGMVRGC